MVETQHDIIDHAEDRPRLRRAADDELDMTPMVDVTFLLLIFFMITAAFALQKSLEVPPLQDEEAAAQAETMEKSEDDMIVVRVDGDNVFWIGAPLWEEEQRAPSPQEMIVRLREARAGRTESRIPGAARMLVLANGDAVHERVVAAVDAGMAVGMEEIQLTSYEEGDL